MRTSFQIGKIMGIPIKLHITCLKSCNWFVPVSGSQSFYTGWSGFTDNDKRAYNLK